MQKVAVIGQGNIGRLHARIYDEMADAKLLAVCDIDPSRAVAGSEALGVPSYGSVTELIEAPFQQHGHVVVGHGHKRATSNPPKQNERQIDQHQRQQKRTNTKRRFGQSGQHGHNPAQPFTNRHWPVVNRQDNPER